MSPVQLPGLDAVVTMLYQENRLEPRHASSGRGVDQTELLVISCVRWALSSCGITQLLHSCRRGNYIS